MLNLLCTYTSLGYYATLANLELTSDPIVILRKSSAGRYSVMSWVGLGGKTGTPTYLLPELTLPWSLDCVPVYTSTTLPRDRFGMASPLVSGAVPGLLASSLQPRSSSSQVV